MEPCPPKAPLGAVPPKAPLGAVSPPKPLSEPICAECRMVMGGRCWLAQNLSFGGRVDGNDLELLTLLTLPSAGWQAIVIPQVLWDRNRGPVH